MANYKHSAARKVAEEVCAKYPNTATLTLARKLKADEPILFSSVETARTMIRYIRGAKSAKERPRATQPRPLGKAGQMPPCPPGFAEEFTPFSVDGCKRVGIISDTHIPYHCKPACESAIRHLRKSNIDTLFINGDLCDFYQVSRWEKDPRKRKFKDELDTCKEFIGWLRECFPKARIVYKLGNHDERWDHFIWHRSPEIFDLPQLRIDSMLDLAKYGVEMVGDKRPVLIGNLPCLHGHELSRGISAPVNPARGAFLKTIHSVLVAHSHRTSTHVEPDMWGKEVAVWSIGMLCVRNPEYDRFAKSNWGFAEVDVESDGQYSVSNYRISNDWKVRTA